MTYLHAFLELCTITLVWTRSSFAARFIHEFILRRLPPECAPDYLQWAACPLCCGAWFAVAIGLFHWSLYPVLAAYLLTQVSIHIYDYLYSLND